MPRYDISRLRKEHNMSQSELSQHLQITQSFLSAIENGKSPLPIEKEEKLREIFNLNSLNPYQLDKNFEQQEKKLTEMTDSDLFNQLLNRFHKQAHSSEDSHHHHEHHLKIENLQDQIEMMFKRNEKLMQRNDHLSEANDRLRAQNDELRAQTDTLRREIDSLRAEIFQLKSNS